MAEFTAFLARRVTMFVIANFWTDHYKHIHLPEVLAARDRLKAYIASEPIFAQHSYCWTVVAHTFDETLWTVNFDAAFDTDVQGTIPTVVELMEAYADVEWFFHNDPTLSKVCWYTGFNQGDHDQ